MSGREGSKGSKEGIPLAISPLSAPVARIPDYTCLYAAHPV